MRRVGLWVMSSLGLAVMVGSAGAQLPGASTDTQGLAGSAPPRAVAHLRPAMHRGIGEEIPSLVGEGTGPRSAAPVPVDSARAAAGAAMRAGVAAPVTAVPVAAPAAPPGRLGLGQPRAMMIVGGAAVILGAVIGDTPGTVIMVGGAIIGLAGLYEYLQ